MSRTNFKELLQAGVHFGHLKKKYNPAMAPYVFMEQNGIHIIDLNKTVAMLEDAAAAMIDGKEVSIEEAIEEAAQTLTKAKFPITFK